MKEEPTHVIEELIEAVKEAKEGQEMQDYLNSSEFSDLDP